MRAAAHEPHPATTSSGGAPAWAAQKMVTWATALGQPEGHRLEVALGAAALGVAGVAPAQEDDLLPSQRVDLGHPKNNRTSRLAWEDPGRW